MLKKVLIIDDSEFMQLMLKDLFASEGFDVVGTAVSVEEGIEKYKEYRPDLVTVDIIMPGESGLKIIPEILKNNKEARILVISSKVQREEFGAEALKMGAKGLLLKPFRPSDFRKEVRKIISDIQE